MAVPNFFIVGASKSGTTSIAQAIGEHTDIFMSNPKEPNFFNRFNDFGEIDTPSRQTYLALFKKVRDEKVVGEASVSYLSSPAAAKNIYSFNPSSRILILLRNPLERIISMYEMYVRHGLDQSFRDATKADSWLVRQNLYSKSVGLYFDVFPEENIKIIEFSDIKNDWDGTLTAIFDFLSLERMDVKRVTMRNLGGIPASPAFSVLKDRRLVNFAKFAIPDLWHESVDRFVKRSAFKKIKIPTIYLKNYSMSFTKIR